MTTVEQPTLYWYVSGPTTQPIEFSLIEADATEPLLTVRIRPPAASGVQAVRLADYGARLRLGVAYDWSITVLGNRQRALPNLVTGGTIERIDLPGGLSTTLSRAGRNDAAARLAESGIWYDALQVLCELTEAEPANTYAREQREALLEQVGLGRLSRQ